MFDHFTGLFCFILFLFSTLWKVRVQVAFSVLSVLDFYNEIKLSFSICEGKVFAVQTETFVMRRK